MEKRRSEKDIEADKKTGVCSVCGQQFSKINPGQIAHHETEKHMPYGGAKKGRKRRLQSLT